MSAWRAVVASSISRPPVPALAAHPEAALAPGAEAAGVDVDEALAAPRRRRARTRVAVAAAPDAQLAVAR